MNNRCVRATLSFFFNFKKKSSFAKTKNRYAPWAMCFFSMFLVTFFFTKPTRGREKKNKMPKEKNALAQCPRPPDQQMTHRTRVERSHTFYQTMIELNSFQSPQKSDFSWYWTFLRGEKNVLDSARIYSTETFNNIANAFVLPRSLANSGKLERGLDSKR